MEEQNYREISKAIKESDIPLGIQEELQELLQEKYRACKENADEEQG